MIVQHLTHGFHVKHSYILAGLMVAFLACLIRDLIRARRELREDQRRFRRDKIRDDVRRAMRENPPRNDVR